jgi:hypothetical protein
MPMVQRKPGYGKYSSNNQAYAKPKPKPAGVPYKPKEPTKPKGYK